MNGWSLTEAADAVACRKATAVELLTCCLAGIDKHEAAVNATIWIDRDGAMQAAEAADREVALHASDPSHTPPLGRLHGVPLAHKDMYYQSGKVSTCGSSIRAEWVADRTATVLDRLHAAGSITFAGLNMAEFAQNTTGHNSHYGDCHNPWSLQRITGGSSSGSGAAVAARLTFGALESDTGGSIRLPASACGVTGLKPTQTRVSRAGVMPLSFSADNVGPLARTARDCARLLSVIAGHDPADPTSARRAVPDYEAGLSGHLQGVRIGVVTNAGLMGTDEEVVLAVATAVQVLRERGAVVTEIELPDMDAVAAYGGIVSRCEGAAIHARWMREQPEAYATHLSGRLYAGFAIPAAYYIEALSARGPLLRQFCGAVFGELDAIVLPTIPTALPTLEETSLEIGHEGAVAKFMALSVNTRPFNYLGLPALSVPCGFDANACPVGLQLVGRPFAEGRLLAIGDAYQQETNWHARLPPMLEHR